MIKAILIFGSEATNHYDETGEIPDPEAFSDTGCLVHSVDFPSKEAYNYYVKALEQAEGTDDYRVVNYEETKYKNLDFRIKEMLREGPVAPIYFWTGIKVLQERISEMEDEQLSEMFGGLIPTDRIRNCVRHISNYLDGLPDDHIPV